MKAVVNSNEMNMDAVNDFLDDLVCDYKSLDDEIDSIDLDSYIDITEEELEEMANSVSVVYCEDFGGFPMSETEYMRSQLGGF